MFELLLVAALYLKYPPSFLRPSFDDFVLDFSALAVFPVFVNAFALGLVSWLTGVKRRWLRWAAKLVCTLLFLLNGIGVPTVAIYDFLEWSGSGEPYDCPLCTGGLVVQAYVFAYLFARILLPGASSRAEAGQQGV